MQSPNCLELYHKTRWTYYLPTHFIHLYRNDFLIYWKVLWQSMWPYFCTCYMNGYTLNNAPKACILNIGMKLRHCLTHFHLKIVGGSLRNCAIGPAPTVWNRDIPIKNDNIQYKTYFKPVLTLLVPSTSSASSLKIASADDIGCNATVMKFVYCTYFWNSLHQTRKSLEYESFDLPSIFYEGVSSCLTEGWFHNLENKLSRLRSVWHFSADHSKPNQPAARGLTAPVLFYWRLSGPQDQVDTREWKNLRHQ